jgi:hypothetical protein
MDPTRPPQDPLPKAPQPPLKSPPQAPRLGRQLWGGPYLPPILGALWAGPPIWGEGRSPPCRQPPQPRGQPLVARREAGARDLVAAPPPPKPALPHLWAGLPNIRASIVFTARPAQRLKKTIGAA